MMENIRNIYKIITSRQRLCYAFCNNVLYVFVVVFLVGGVAGYILATSRCPKQHQESVQVESGDNSPSYEKAIVQDATSTAKTDQYDKDDCIFVDISGAIIKPGVYCMPQKATLYDLVEKAGGFNSGGYARKFVSQRVNLAQALKSHAKYYIPYDIETVCEPLITNPVCSDSSIDGMIARTDMVAQNCGKGGVCEENKSASTKKRKTNAQTKETKTTNEDANQKFNDSSDTGNDTTNAEAENTTETGDCININTATSEELESLNGVGPSTARKIIDNRPYETLDDLLEVRGIGETTLNKMREKLCKINSESEDQ